MPRPREQERRPERIAIKDGWVRCYHRHCFYTSGPHLSRIFAVTAAWEHHRNIHAPRRYNRRPW